MIRTSYKKFFDNSKKYVVAENNVIPTYDGRNLLNVKPITQRIDFTGGVNTTNIVWNQDNSEVTITHTMNCIPIVACYDNSNNQIDPDI